MALNIKNFWDASVGMWTEIDSVPEHFTLFAKSGKSSYYTNEAKDTVVRSSDHWGSGVRNCNWYLSGYNMNNSFLWKRLGGTGIKFGMIKIKDLIDVRLEIDFPIDAKPIYKPVKHSGGEEIKQNKRDLLKALSPLRDKLRENGSKEILKKIGKTCKEAVITNKIGKRSIKKIRKKIERDFNIYLFKNGKHINKCCYPDCEEEVTRNCGKKIGFISRWGWNYKWYCADHIEYGENLAKKELIRIFPNGEAKFWILSKKTSISLCEGIGNISNI